jgi:hypothetical protein
VSPTEHELHGYWGLTRQAAHQAFHAIGGRDVHVTSGFRTVQRNRAIGGVEGSYHTRRRAVDLVGLPSVLGEILVHAHEHGAVEALHEYRGTRREHLHLAF